MNARRNTMAQFHSRIRSISIQIQIKTEAREAGQSISGGRRGAKCTEPLSPILFVFFQSLPHKIHNAAQLWLISLAVNHSNRDRS